MNYYDEECGTIITLSPSEEVIYNQLEIPTDLLLESGIQAGVNKVLDRLGDEYIHNYESLFYGG